MSDSEPIVVWGDPPIRRGGGGDSARYADHMKLIREHPGRWGCIARFPDARKAHTAANGIRQYKVYQKLAQPGRFDVVTRRTPSGDHGIWARWIAPSGKKG